MSDAEMPTPPREPEIEFLGKCARIGLRVLRTVLWLGGVAALSYGCCKAYDPEFRLWFQPQVPDPFAADPTFPSALGMVWITVGIPLVARANWLLSPKRGLTVVLGVSVVLWFGTMLLADDTRYGFILRMAATLIAFVCLLVWRTLWRLTPEGSEPIGSPD